MKALDICGQVDGTEDPKSANPSFSYFPPSSVPSHVRSGRWRYISRDEFVQQWFPTMERSRLLSVSLSGSQLGTILILTILNDV